MTRSRHWLAAAMTAGLLANCGTPTTNLGGIINALDVSIPGDTAAMDGGTTPMDGGGMKMTGDGGVRPDARADATTDRPPPRDTGPAITNPCATDAQVDLTSRMPNAMGLVVYQGNNNRAPEMGGVNTPMGCLAGQMMPFIGYQVAHRYRMRATAVLEATTVSDNTLETLDTAVVIATACSPTGMSLGCSDDVSQMVVQSRARSAAPIMAGTEVFVIVGSYNPAVNNADTQGDYELTLREIVPVPVGMTCRATDVCADGSACIATMTGATMGTCVADGTQTGRCRLTGTACDMGLACSVAMPTMTARGVCQRTLMPGAECGLPGTVCAMGSTCQAAPTAMSLTRRECVGDGLQGGNCRTTDPRCDGMLQCSANNACRASVMTGAECDISGRRNFCPMGNACVINAMLNGGTCVATGSAAGAPCRDATDGGTRCDAGLTCSTMTGAGVCRREVAVGMPCDLRFNTTVCAMDGLCQPGMDPARGTCTAPTPEMEMNNTPMTGNGPVTTSTVFRAALPANDVDCFRVTVPMGASIRAETTDANGTCNLGMGADTVVTLTNAMGVELASNDDGPQGLCSLIDPTMEMGARNLPAGTYSVCVEAYVPMSGMSVPIASYFLRIGVTTP